MATQPAPQVPTPLRIQVPIEEAARRLGVSQATIRRRIKRGHLRGLRHELASGFQWYVELAPDDPGEAPHGEAPHVGRQADSQVSTQPDASHREIVRLEEHIGDLRRRVDDQAREIAELHRLLAQSQQLALMAPQAATQADRQAATQEEAEHVGTHAATHVSTQTESVVPEWGRRRWWQRLVWG